MLHSRILCNWKSCIHLSAWFSFDEDELVTRYSLLLNFYSLIVTTYSLLVTFYSLRVTFYTLLLTRCSLLLSCYFLLVTRYFSFVTRCYLLVTLYFNFHSSIRIHYSLLFTRYFISLVSTIYLINFGSWVMLRTLI